MTREWRVTMPLSKGGPHVSVYDDPEEARTLIRAYRELGKDVTVEVREVGAWKPHRDGDPF